MYGNVRLYVGFLFGDYHESGFGIDGHYKSEGYSKLFLCDLYLYPLLTSKFIYDNGGCQKGKGTDFALNRFSGFLRDFFKQNKNDGYILKADICHFFPTIDHKVLKNRLSRIIIDKDIYNLVCGIIDSYNADTGKGIPMGNQTSQLFALYYLDQMDRLIQE